MFSISTLLKSILLSAILIVAFWIRIQSTTAIPEGHFTGVDAYTYYFQAQQISELGKLPERDMHRWMPLGRDNGQALNLYGYVLAYAYKAVGLVFPSVTLYHVALYMPPVCFCIGLGVLYIFLYYTYGTLFSSVVGVLLATLPGAINRSTAGFSDRDAWCLMLGLLAVVTYLVSLQIETSRKRLIWTLTSGLIVFLGGLSWEGFGVFLSVILIVELYRFLSSETEEGLGHCALWVCCFVPTLYLSSPAYRNGYGFAKHLFVFVLVTPMMLLGIRALRHLLLSKVEKLQPHARTLALSLALASVVLATGYVLIQRNTFAETTVPLSQNALMQNVGELRDTNSYYWIIRYGYIFVLSIIGVMISALHQWKNHGVVLVIPFTLFTFTTFFREYPDALWGAENNNILFFVAAAATAMTLMFMVWRFNFHPKNEFAFVAAISWFLIWISLSRDAERYSSFTSLALAFFTAELIQFCSIKLSNAFRRYLPWSVIKVGTAVIFLAIFMWIPFPYGYAQNILPATHARRSNPIHRTVAETFQWMKAELPNTAVIAGDWIHGGQLNVLGGVKTITDQDHFIQHWIHLYYRYLFCGQSEKEALEFLKSHEATHLMLTEVDVVSDSPVYSVIGSRSEQDPSFEIIELRETLSEQEHLFLSFEKERSFFNHIQINMHPENNMPISAIAIRQNGTTTNLPYVAFKNKKRTASENQESSETGGILLYFDEQQKFQKCYYVPPIAWDNFAIRLFLRGIPSDAFLPVHTNAKMGATAVKVWEIHYPPDIKPNPKYLKTGVSEIDAQLQLQ
ncbi:hypothetical protein F4X88_15110 [Candidatus Poribacteria bacterium]|nr:hypothetical protein [Candidatus Poribacteria bacterium]MYA57615.1 hypothetical protein [Candidatus Poribacteria bacterium]